MPASRFVARPAPRAVALAVALALAASACAAAEDLADDARDAASDVADDARDAASDLADEVETLVPDPTGGGTNGGDGGDGGPGDEPTGGDGGGGGGAATEQPGAGGEATPVDDLGPVGANGRAMLRGDRPALVVEVDVQEGVSPDPAALDHLVAELDRHADKPGGIRFEGGNGFASDRTSWSAGDLREAASQHRSTSSTGDATSLYVLYVRGGFSSGGEETNAIGVTYNASEIAIFPEQWAGLGDVLGSNRAIERAVLVHELGHALGLVNLTYTSPIDHEDPDHPGHSSNRGSVMYWAVETTLIGQVFDGPPPDRFDDADAADLRGLRDGSL